MVCVDAHILRGTHVLFLVAFSVYACFRCFLTSPSPCLCSAGCTVTVHTVSPPLWRNLRLTPSLGATTPVKMVNSACTHKCIHIHIFACLLTIFFAILLSSTNCIYSRSQQDTTKAAKVLDAAYYYYKLMLNPALRNFITSLTRFPVLCIKYSHHSILWLSLFNTPLWHPELINGSIALYLLFVM